MEDKHPPSTPPSAMPPTTRSEIDTTRPFRSVKEAVAIFGDRILSSGEFSTPRPVSRRSSSNEWWINQKRCSPKEEEDVESNELKKIVEKLEAELEETKREVRLLKERESETEIAVASLNEEVRRKVAAAGGDSVSEDVTECLEKERREFGLEFDEYCYLPSLGGALSLGEREGLFGERKVMKSRKVLE
ncbi:WEB family protein [Acorus calamus]|uniref:WEB family protein n=1 Tax=Acorus calamus TaxID=4465 RepID=A0AAV9FFP1_ACOCL|nr:WEB family protein [Acorus calamus]